MQTTTISNIKAAAENIGELIDLAALPENAHEADFFTETMITNSLDIVDWAKSLLADTQNATTPTTHTTINDLKTSVRYTAEVLSVLKAAPHADTIIATLEHLSEAIDTISDEVDAVESKFINVFRAMAELINQQQCECCDREE